MFFVLFVLARLEQGEQSTRTKRECSFLRSRWHSSSPYTRAISINTRILTPSVASMWRLTPLLVGSPPYEAQRAKPA